MEVLATDVHLLIIKIDSQLKRAYYYIDGVLKDTKTINNSGSQIQIAAYNGGYISSNAYVSYLAVVNEAESDEIIIQNCNYIKSYYSNESYIWATSANNGIAIPNITEDITSNMNLYLARWTVNYYSNDGLTLLYTEYVSDESDAEWGANYEWSDQAEGTAVIGILENINANVNVFLVTSELIIYSYGIENISLIVQRATKQSNQIDFDVGGGTFVCYTLTDSAIDLPYYNLLKVTYLLRGTQYINEFDISSYSGNYFLSFRYLTDSSHNEVNVGLSQTKDAVGTFQVDRTTYVWSGLSLQEMILS